MSRLYFEDPIQALYMMRGFGVKFESFDYYSLINQIEQNKSSSRFYVAKESEYIFEVKEQDVIIVAETDLYVVDSEYEGKDHQAISLVRAKSLDSCEIIMRGSNNKRFFTALVEE